MADHVVSVPDDERERLDALRALHILDTPKEASFDRIVTLAASLLEVPIAAISLVDVDRQWYKAIKGLEVEQTAREVAFCAYTIMGTETMVVPDATVDGRFADNPLVRGEPGIRFYAGAPLRTADGHNLGTLCAIDRQPRQLTTAQGMILASLAAVVMDLIEARRSLQRAQLAETRLVDAVEALSDGFVLYDKDDRLFMRNERYREIYAASAEALVTGRTFEDILRHGLANGQYPDALGREEEWLRARLARHRDPGSPIEQQLPGNRWLRVEERRTREGGFVGFGVDITQLKRQQRELERLASHDGLTGVLTRRRFLELTDLECERVHRTKQSTAILLVDADHFKQINDRHGHAAGDAVLVSLTSIIRSSLREHDLLGRLGGEEFAMLLPVIDIPSALGAAERIRAKVADTTVLFGGHEIGVTLSLGVTMLDDEVDTTADAIARADEALYLAKQSGRNRIGLRLARCAARLADRLLEVDLGDTERRTGRQEIAVDR